MERETKMKVTSLERRATKLVFDLLEDKGYWEDDAIAEIGRKLKIEEKRLSEVITYIDESRRFTDNGTTMIRVF